MRVIVFLCTVFLSVNAFAKMTEGGGISGGGDAYAAEFTQVGYDVLKNLTRAPIEGVDVALLKGALQSVRVTTQDKVMLDQAEVDAINTPSQKTILISRTRWSELANKPRQKFVFVAHEYFSVMGLSDARYQLSQQMFSNPGVALYRYDCPFAEIPGDPIFSHTGLRMQVDLYEKFVNISFRDEKGKSLDSGIQSFYSENLNQLERVKGADSKFYMKQGVMVSINLELGVQVINLLYSTDPKEPLLETGSFSADTRILSGLEDNEQSSKFKIACQVKKF